MRRNNSLWKTTVVSLSAMMTVSMGAAVWAASTEKTTQESQSDQVTEENSETKADTKDTENQTSEPQSAEDVSDSSENQTEECKITLSDDGILVDGEAISTDSESAVYAGADIVYYKEGQDSTYGAGNEDDGHSEEEAAEHTVVTITKAGTYRVSGTLSKGQIAIDLGEDSRDDTLYEISSADGVAVSGLYTEVTSVSDEVQLQGSNGAGGFGGMGGGMGKPNGERPEMPEGEESSMPEGEMLSGQEGEVPSKPEGEAPSGQNGERPDMPEDISEEASSVFTISGISNAFSRISELTIESSEAESSTNV